MLGWIDNGKKKKKGSCYRNVIVAFQEFDDDSNIEEFETYVKESSYRKRWSRDARTFEEAAIMQHSDMEKAMIELAEMFASIGWTNTNHNALLLFDAELTRAKNNIQKLGSKARFRAVDFRAHGQNTGDTITGTI